MSKKKLPNGVWPVMVTPFKEDGGVDYDAFESLVDYYIGAGVSGLFACCGSSEITMLSKQEMLDIAGRVLECNRGRVPVVSGAIIFESFSEQVEFALQMAALSPDAVIFSPTQLAAKDEDDGLLLERIKEYTRLLPPHIKLGTYEFPYPYHRLITNEAAAFMASSGRYVFHKDTSCDMNNMRAKLAAVKGSDIVMVNAHTQTLLEFLQAGGGGFCGCTANYCPELFVWMCSNFGRCPEKAAQVQDYINSFESRADEYGNYPVSAKAYMAMRGVAMTDYSRKVSQRAGYAQKEQMREMLENTARFFEQLNNSN